MSVQTEWEPVIGLEIHVQLKTRTKMFCGCELSFGDPPNTHTCPVCLGLPGSLPTINAEAVHLGLLMALAFHCDIPERSIFARKHYFYPDLPKGYQISQFDQPLCVNGRLGDVRIHRIHLEEDAAKLVHTGSTGRIAGATSSVVDYNRGGTPLAEMVTEPDIRSAEQARDWLQLLRETLRQLGVSDVNMDEGSLRCDANISIRPRGSTELGTKTELKNMNSFRHIMHGINTEIDRQIRTIESGETVKQASLHYDPTTGSISLLRSKENSPQYRYFPDADLSPVRPTPEMLDRARAALPVLPESRIQKYEDLGFPLEDAKTLAFRPRFAEYFEACVAAGGSPKELYSWVVAELGKRTEDPFAIDPSVLVVLVGKVTARTLTSTAGIQALELLLEGGELESIIKEHNLATSDEGLDAAVDQAIAQDPESTDAVRSGNMAAIGRLVGATMKIAGKADGKVVREKLLAKLT